MGCMKQEQRNVKRQSFVTLEKFMRLSAKEKERVLIRAGAHEALRSIWLSFDCRHYAPMECPPSMRKSLLAELRTALVSSRLPLKSKMIIAKDCFFWLFEFEHTPLARNFLNEQVEISFNFWPSAAQQILAMTDLSTLEVVGP